MAAANAQRNNDLGHITGIVHAIRQELGQFRAVVILRFDQSDATMAALRARINNLEDSMLSGIEIQQIRTDIATSHNALDELGQSVNTAQLAMTTRLEKAQTEIQKFAGQAIHASQQTLSADIAAAEASAIQAMGLSIDTCQEKLSEIVEQQQSQTNDRIKESERRIKEEIDLVKQEAIGATTHAVDDCRGRLEDTLSGTKGTIMEATDHIRNSQIVSNGRLSEAYDKLEVIDLLIQDTRSELRAGHFNDAARLANKSASCCNHAISMFRGIANQRIPNFPTTHGEFSALRGEIDVILDKLGLSVTGTLTRKQARLKTYLGIKM